VIGIAVGFRCDGIDEPVQISLAKLPGMMPAASGTGSSAGCSRSKLASRHKAVLYKENKLHLGLGKGPEPADGLPSRARTGRASDRLAGGQRHGEQEHWERL